MKIVSFVITAVSLASAFLLQNVKAECPPDGMMKVASTCMPLQGMLPSLMSAMTDMAQIQSKSGSFSSADIAKLREDANGLCKNSDGILSCLRLLQNCPNVLTMITGLVGSSKMPANLPELINDGSALFINMCVKKSLSQYVDCIDRNNGVNIKEEYCGSYKGFSVGDFAGSFSSFASLMPGRKPAADTKQAEPLDCPQFTQFSGCMASSLKKVCGQSVADAMHTVSKVQGKIAKPPCPLPATVDAAEAEYLKNAPATQARRPQTAPATPAARPAAQTAPPRVNTVTVKDVVEPCPSNAMMQVMSKCLPLQSQLPSLLGTMNDMTRIQEKTSAFTSAEITKMRESVDGFCRNSDAVLGCLRLLRSCPSILSMASSLGSSVKLPPNLGELISDGVGLLTSMCVNKALPQYVDCIEQNNGVNIKAQYCSAYKGTTFGDFSGSFSSFSSIMPGSKPSSSNKAAEPLDCRQFSLFSGCMASNIKKVCSPNLADVMYSASKVQGKTNNPPCQMPSNADAAEAEYLRNAPQSSGGSQPSRTIPTQAPRQQQTRPALPPPIQQQTPPPIRFSTVKMVTEPCPSNSLMQVMSKCMPLQSQIPGLMGLMSDMTRVQEKNSAFTSAEIAKMRESANGICRSSEPILGCLRLLQSCPSILGMASSMGPSIKLPPNIGELINDGVALLNTMCVSKALPLFVDCIERNNGVNIKAQYCSAYKGAAFGDFSGSFSSFTSLMPGSKPSAGGAAPAPLDCGQFPLFSGCMASNIKKFCGSDMAEAMYSSSKVQAKTNKPPCQVPPNANAAEAEYLKSAPQPVAEVTTRYATRPAVQTPPPSVITRPAAQTRPPSVRATTKAVIEPCPSNAMMQVMSKCMPLQSQLPSLMALMSEMTRIQEKNSAFTSAEISKMRESANGMCKSSEAILGCLRLLQSCPSILSMASSLGSSIKLPPNLGELISDGVGLLTTMCVNKALPQYVDCIEQNNGANIKAQYCSAYKGVSFGDFSGSFSSFSNIMPGSKPSGGNKTPEPLDCRQLSLFSGCMASNIKRLCSADIADAMYSAAKVQGKTNNPPCPMPADADAAEAEYLKNAPQTGVAVVTTPSTRPPQTQPPYVMSTAKTTIEPCPSDSMMQVMSKCMPLQTQMPAMLNLMSELTRIQDKTSAFTSAEISKMRESVNGLCQNSNTVLGCLRLLQSCPNILGMIGSMGVSIKLPPNMGELINDGVGLLTTTCTNKGFSQYVDCIERNNGVNIKGQYCSAYKGPSLSDFSSSFSSFSSLMPGSKSSGTTTVPLDCSQFGVFSGCMASNIKKMCGRDLAEAMYTISKVQGKANQPPCQMPANADAAEAEYLKNGPQTAATPSYTESPVQTTASVQTTPAAGSCPDDPLSKLMEVCLPLQTQMPTLLNYMSDFVRIQNKRESFTFSEIAKMREDVYTVCKSGDAMLSCLRLLQTCPSIISMISNLGANIKLPPNMLELVNDGVLMLTTMCTNKALLQYVDCIEMHDNGVNFRYQSCSAYQSVPLGDFSASFSSFTSLMPGGGNKKPPVVESVDCQQLLLYSGCLACSVQKMCNTGLYESVYTILRIQGKSNVPSCQLPASVRAAQAEYLNSKGQPTYTTKRPVTYVTGRPCYPLTTTICPPCYQVTTTTTATTLCPPCYTTPNPACRTGTAPYRETTRADIISTEGVPTQDFFTPQGISTDDSTTETTTFGFNFGFGFGPSESGTAETTPGIIITPGEAVNTGAVLNPSPDANDQPTTQSFYTSGGVLIAPSSKRPVTTTLSDAVAIPLSLYEWSDEENTGRNSVYQIKSPIGWLFVNVFISSICLVLS